MLIEACVNNVQENIQEPSWWGEEDSLLPDAKHLIAVAKDVPGARTASPTSIWDLGWKQTVMPCITKTKLIVNITNQRIKDVLDGNDYRNNERTITSSGRQLAVVIVIATLIISALSD